MKKQFLILVMMMMPFVVSAESFVVDGIKYETNIFSSTLPGINSFNVIDGISVVGVTDQTIQSINIPTFVTYNEETYCVRGINEKAFSKCSQLSSVTLSDSITSISYSAFEGTPWFNNQPDGVIYINELVYRYKGQMPQNAKIDIKDGVKRISPFAFYNSGNLISIYLPNSIESIGYGTFRDCI